MEQPSIEAVPRHQGSAGQRAAAGTVSTQQVAQSSDVERSQLHRPTGDERQLRAEEGQHLAGTASLSRGLMYLLNKLSHDTAMTAATVTRVSSGLHRVNLRLFKDV